MSVLLINEKTMHDVCAALRGVIVGYDGSPDWPAMGSHWDAPAQLRALGSPLNEPADSLLHWDHIGLNLYRLNYRAYMAQNYNDEPARLWNFEFNGLDIHPVQALKSLDFLVYQTAEVTKLNAADAALWGRLDSYSDRLACSILRQSTVYTAMDWGRR